MHLATPAKFLKLKLLVSMETITVKQKLGPSSTCKF